MEDAVIGGEADHAHALISLPSSLSIAKAIQLLKAPSSKWLHEQMPALQHFAWQEGYGAFSVGNAAVPNVRGYIEQQVKHHHQQTYQKEFLTFLQRYQIPYDARYIWDDNTRIVEL